MRLVRGRSEARWFPSRHNFALFRLAAYVRLRNARPEPFEGIVAIDRYQSNLEMFLVAAWIVLTVACYLTVTIFASWPVPLAFAIAVPVALAGVEVPMILWGVVLNLVTPAGKDITRANSVSMMLLFFAAAAYFATRPMWVRFAAWQVLILGAANAVASAVVFLLREDITRREAAIGGTTSAH
jgi:hypothetical protein